jgi:hypothetical protein
MRRRRLTELAENPDLIPGIYNYCDRWCERCSFTSRCLVFATEQEDNDENPAHRDITNEQFWQRLSLIFKETKEMILEWANEEGIDLENIDEDEIAWSEKQHDDAERHPLAVSGKRYADEVRKWFAEYYQTLESSDVESDETDEEQADQVRDATEVLFWYQYQIAVKTIRALWSRSTESDEWTGESDSKDSDGSAKVALVGLDRSIAAWRLMQLSLPERSELIVPLILHLERLRNATEKEFPNARDFIRPGFDEGAETVN